MKLYFLTFSREPFCGLTGSDETRDAINFARLITKYWPMKDPKDELSRIRPSFIFLRDAFPRNVRGKITDGY